MNKKVAIYIRVSTHWQVDKDSLKVQERELIAYATMILQIPDYEIFTDAGYSAKNTDRPDYQRMMARLRYGEFSHLLVWKIDRISRNLLDFTMMYKELQKLGVTFVSKNEQFDTSSAIGEAMLKIILVFAELERNMTSERVSAVMISRATQGQWNGGRVPYGYEYNKEIGNFVYCDAEKNTTQLLFETYLAKRSIIITAQTLNSQKLPTRKGNEWSPPSVYRILRSPFYCGIYSYNINESGSHTKHKDASEQVYVPNHHPAYITQNQHEVIGTMLDRNRRGGYNNDLSRHGKNIHIFAGIIRCGMCKNNMTATQDKCRVDGYRPSTYGCATRRKHKDTCTNKYITDVPLGNFTFNYIAALLRFQNNAETFSENILAYMKDFGVKEIDGLKDTIELMQSGTMPIEYIVPKTTTNANAELNTLQDKKRKTEIALRRLETLYLFDENAMSPTEYIEAKDRLNKELQQYREAIAELGECVVLDDEGFAAKASYFLMVEQLAKADKIDFPQMAKNLDKSILKEFMQNIVKHIYVLDSRVIEISFANGIKHNFTYINS